MAAPKTLEAAGTYLGHGWSVIPIESGGKRPLVRWEEFQQRHASAQEVKSWSRRWPDANLAIVTGQVSKLVVLDVDPRHGGEQSLADLERQHGPLPQSVEAVTGGGGRHVYFEHPGGVMGNRVGLAPGIDLRGDGGVIVAPPSLHPSGRRYLWKASHGPDETSLAPMPHWLRVLALGEPEHPGHPLSHWRHLVRAGVPEGERNNTVASLTGHLLWYGLDPQVALELLLCWNRVRCQPPLDDAEVARTVESIRRTHFGQRGGKPVADPLKPSGKLD